MPDAPPVPDGPPARVVAERMRVAASAWLDALTPAQRERARWAAPGASAEADAERVRWFYTPTDHGGLPVGEQRPAQQRLAMRLLGSGLSTAGFVTVCTIMGWENVLDQADGYRTDWGRERGRDPGLYYLRVFGDPGTDRVWGWRFGGHHVSLHFLVVDGAVRAGTPCFIGADPAAAPGLGGAAIRPLGRLEDLAGQLVRSLPPEQLAVALLWPQAPTDIVGGNRSRVGPGDRRIPLTGIWRGRFADPVLAGRLDAMSRTAEERSGVTDEGHERLALTDVPKGLPATALDAEGRRLLAELVTGYTGRIADGLAVEPDPTAVHFAWAGSVRPGEPHYYRLQAPRFLAEWDNTQRGANHAHSVWRDPEADFGTDLLAEHRARHHHPADRPDRAD